MYNKNEYVNLIRKQEKEFNNFPMFFAYNEKQYKEGKQTLGFIYKLCKSITWRKLWKYLRKLQRICTY